MGMMMPQQLQPQIQQQSSPKSKPKMSPRTGGQIGRPPGPAKSALPNLRGPTSSMSPPRLPGSPVQVANPQLLGPGPPVLQTSQGALLPSSVSQGVVYSQPPKLQPMLPTTSTATSSSPIASMPMPDPSRLISSSATPLPFAKATYTAPAAVGEKKPLLGGGAGAGGGVGDVAKPPASSKIGGGALENGKADGEKQPAHTLTHYIDGFVIQESGEPFPIDREDKGKDGGGKEEFHYLCRLHRVLHANYFFGQPDSH